jgi:SNF family Na+-dependent transporter
LKENDDIVLTGLATSSMNEFCEVVLGGSIAIPAATAFFGAGAATAIAKAGTFNLGFQTMPAVFSTVPAGFLFGGIWFTLLFFAGITSSLALSQPALAFLQDELKLSRQKAALIVGGIVLVGVTPIVLFLQHGYLDEFDFWSGEFLLLVFALIESILFFWIFGGRKAFAEIKKGQQINLPGFFYPIMKYVVPTLISVILFKGTIDSLIPRMLSQKWVDAPSFSKDTATFGERLMYEFGLAGRSLVADPAIAEQSFLRWMARLEMIALCVLILVLTKIAWKKYGRGRLADTEEAGA